jgi:hypothetical protein
MGTVIQRRRADGTLTYSAQISLMKNGAIVHRESRTFGDRGIAERWVDKREKELAKPGGSMRRKSFWTEFTNAIAGIETLRNQMLESRSEAARQVAAGLNAALCALGRNLGESAEFKE